jgi:hypothetical protein
VQRAQLQRDVKRGIVAVERDLARFIAQQIHRLVRLPQLAEVNLHLVVDYERAYRGASVLRAVYETSCVYQTDGHNETAVFHRRLFSIEKLHKPLDRRDKNKRFLIFTSILIRAISLARVFKSKSLWMKILSMFFTCVSRGEPILAVLILL